MTTAKSGTRQIPIAGQPCSAASGRAAQPIPIRPLTVLTQVRCWNISGGCRPRALARRCCVVPHRMSITALRGSASRLSPQMGAFCVKASTWCSYRRIAKESTASLDSSGRLGPAAVGRLAKAAPSCQRWELHWDVGKWRLRPRPYDGMTAGPVLASIGAYRQEVRYGTRSILQRYSSQFERDWGPNDLAERSLAVVEERL